MLSLAQGCPSAATWRTCGPDKPRSCTYPSAGCIGDDSMGGLRKVNNRVMLAWFCCWCPNGCCPQVRLCVIGGSCHWLGRFSCFTHTWTTERSCQLSKPSPWLFCLLSEIKVKAKALPNNRTLSLTPDQRKVKKESLVGHVKDGWKLAETTHTEKWRKRKRDSCDNHNSFDRWR